MSFQIRRIRSVPGRDSWWGTYNHRFNFDNLSNRDSFSLCISLDADKTRRSPRSVRFIHRLRLCVGTFEHATHVHGALHRTTKKSAANREDRVSWRVLSDLLSFLLCSLHCVYYARSRTDGVARAKKLDSKVDRSLVGVTRTTRASTFIAHAIKSFGASRRVVVVLRSPRKRLPDFSQFFYPSAERNRWNCFGNRMGILRSFVGFVK